MQNGIAAMTWGCSGYRLVLAEAGMSAQVLELSLAKSPRGSHRILHPWTSQAGSGIPAPSEIHILQVRHSFTGFACLGLESLSQRFTSQTQIESCPHSLHGS